MRNRKKAKKLGGCLIAAALALSAAAPASALYGQDARQGGLTTSDPFALLAETPLTRDPDYAVNANAREDVRTRAENARDAGKTDRYLVKYASGVIETVRLTEKITPQEFRAELMESAGKDGIVWAQPDYILRPAGAEPDSPDLSDEFTDLADDPGKTQEDREEPEPAEEPGSGSPGLVAGRTGVTVALIDSAVNTGHEEIRSFIADGWDFIHNQPYVYDKSEMREAAHGTAMAGLIAEVIATSAPEYSGGIRIVPLIAFGNGKSYTSDILGAVSYANGIGADIIVMCFSGSGDNRALYEAVAESPALVVAAAGNNGADLSGKTVSPGSFKLANLISAGAVNDDGRSAYFSNYGAGFVDIAAEGRARAASPNGRKSPVTGTSVAAAKTAGAAAALLAKARFEEAADPARARAEAADIKNSLLDSADRIAGLEGKVSGGRCLNTANALSGKSGRTRLPDNHSGGVSVGRQQPPDGNGGRTLSRSAGQSGKLIAGSGVSFYITENKDVWGWGFSVYGQLTYNAPDPGFFAEMPVTGIVSLAAGSYHVLAAKEDGSLYSWGDGNWFQLGVEDVYYSDTPLLVPGAADIIEVAAGETHSVALDSQGNVLTWGYDSFGQLGQGWTGTYYEPAFTDLHDIIAIAAGRYHSLALDNTGGVWAWGDNWAGQVDAGVDISAGEPVETSLTGVTAIAAGEYSSFAIKEDGSLWAWGNNDYGQLGTGGYVSVSAPQEITGIDNVVAVNSFESHNFAVRDDGGLWGWGDNGTGQLGCDFPCYDSNIPVPVEGLPDVVSAAAGAAHSAAEKDDGSLWAWGQDTVADGGVPVMVLGPVSPGGSGAETSDTIEISAVTGGFYDIAVTAGNLKDPGVVNVKLEYNQAAFGVKDLCLMTKAEETNAITVPEAGVTFTGVVPGEIEFTADRQLPAGKERSGAVNIIRLQAKNTGNSSVTVTVSAGNGGGSAIYSRYDLNKDGKVNSLDLAICLLYVEYVSGEPYWNSTFKVLDSFGSPVFPYMCDFNNDGIVNMADLLLLMANYS